MHASFTATLSAEAYRTLADLVYQHSRIRLGPDKQPMLANRLRKRLRALGLVSYDEYCAVLRSDRARMKSSTWWISFPPTTRSSSASRSISRFSRTGFCPSWFRGSPPKASPLRVWSAAASSGEEPYTLAIVLAEFFRQHPSVDWQVEASDISHRMLDHAQRGHLPAGPRPARLSRNSCSVTSNGASATAPEPAGSKPNCGSACGFSASTCSRPNTRCRGNST